MSVSDRDQRLIDAINPEVIAQPKCPGCNHAPLEFHCNVVKTGAGHIVSIIWCSHCGHTLQTQFMGIEQPQQPQIVRPS